MFRSRAAVRQRTIAALAVAATFLAAGGSASALTFSAPARIAGAPYTTAHALTALDCVGGRLCVVGDEAGNLITTTKPTGGPSAWPIAEQVDPTARITAVACPSTTLCVAAGGDGAILHSTRPTGGAFAWRVVRGALPPGDSLTSLSCPSVTLCVGVDPRGNFVTTRHPTGGARAWRSAHVFTQRDDTLIKVVCPSVSECLALDDKGQDIVHSTRPTGGRDAWRRTPLSGLDSEHPSDLACASRSLCVILGLDHEELHLLLATSTHPTGGRSAWRFKRVKAGHTTLLSVVSCPSTRLCVLAGGFVGTRIVYSTDPGRGATSYHDGFHGAKAPSVGALSCASATLCVALRSTDGSEPDPVIATDKPTSTTAADWPTFGIDAYNALESVSCPSATECVAGGTPKAAFVTANPTGGAGGWSATPLSDSADQVSCGAADQCAAASTGDNLFATTTPLTGGWVETPRTAAEEDGGDDGITALSCVAGPFCVAAVPFLETDGDDEGTVTLVSADPTVPAAWGSGGYVEGGINGGGRAGGGDVPSLTCASATLCVAGDAAGGILTTDMPAVDGRTWQYTRADGSAAIVGLACPSTSLCVGVDSQGRVIHSTHPTSGGWGAATIDKGFALTAVSCASADFCVAVDGHRHAFVSTHPTGGATAWRAIDARDGDLTSISCPTASLCVAVDGQGNEVAATG